MRSFQLAAIIVASLGVSADMSATVTFPKACGRESSAAVTTAAEVKAAMGTADAKCTTATVDVTYSHLTATKCEGVKEKFALDAVAADLKNMGTSTSVLLTSLKLDYADDIKTGCKGKLNTVVRKTDCSGTLTPLDVTRASATKSVEFKPKTGENIDLKSVGEDLLAELTGCPSTDDKEPTKVTLQLEETFTLPASPTPSPTLKDVTVTFAEADCQLTECAAATVTDSKSAIACLTAASKDSNCKTATYTRTFENVAGAACDDKPATKLHMSLDAIKTEESEIDSDKKTITLTDAHFPMKPKDPKQCTDATLVLAKDCPTAGTPSTLKQIDDKKTLDFNGEQTVDLASDAFDLIADYPEAVAGQCTLEADTAGDKITVKTEITIPHGDSPSGSLAQFSFTGLLMAAVYVISAL